MRKILTIFSFFLLIFQVKAQSFYQINAGSGVTFLNRQEYKNNLMFDQKIGIGARFGISYCFKFNPKFEIQLGTQFIFFTDKNRTKKNVFLDQMGNLETNTFIQKNRDYCLAIPFSIQYFIKNNDKMSYFLDCGFAANFLMLSQFTSSRKINITSDRNSLILLPSISLGFGAEYKLNENSFLIVKPNFTHLFEPLLISIFSGNKAINYLGLDVSMKYPF